uniref:Uncharacterized protein n=1 Tax=Glossina palpalis gambiensis TaxID=67801 RepID=A0A1B0AXI0_9MUSC
MPRCEGVRENELPQCLIHSSLEILQQHFKTSGFKRVQIPIRKVDNTEKNPNIAITKFYNRDSQNPGSEHLKTSLNLIILDI